MMFHVAHCTHQLIPKVVETSWSPASGELLIFAFSSSSLNIVQKLVECRLLDSIISDLRLVQDLESPDQVEDVRLSGAFKVETVCTAECRYILKKLTSLLDSL